MLPTRVIEVGVPDASELLGTLKTVHFCDAYQAGLTNPALSIQDIYRALFENSSRWVGALMKCRGIIAKAVGLKHDANGDFADASTSYNGARYQIGQRVGFFTVRSIESAEMIVGDDDKHLDFRISIFKSSLNGVESVTVSSAVEIHNMLGRIYMLVIKPFHRIIVKSMVQRAVSAGRL